MIHAIEEIARQPCDIHKIRRSSGEKTLILWKDPALAHPPPDPGNRYGCNVAAES
jgi:hypothetical protein